MDDIKSGFKVPVGLLGQIKVLIRGKVEYGDFIISGDNGIGVVSKRPTKGTIIGRAMESNSFIGEKEVLCLVQPQ